MKKREQDYVQCAHCGVKVRFVDAIHPNSFLVNREHYHCKDCDPRGVWDCMSNELDHDLH
jgi:hypothetical protein